jgi:hypothetical protein
MWPLVSPGGLLVYLVSGKQYEHVHRYWIVNFITLFLGCGILCEIFARIWLQPSKLRRAGQSGRWRALMQALALGILFLLIEVNSPFNRIACGRLERDCPAAQAVFFSAIAYAALYFRVPIERSLRSIYPGYGLYLGLSLLDVAARPCWSSEVSMVTADIRPASFDAAIAVWLGGLWNSGGARARDCKQFLEPATNLPAPAIEYRHIARRRLQMAARA